MRPGGEGAEDQEELIVLINSPSVSVSVSSSPQSWSSAGMLRLPLGREVCSAPVPITHSVEHGRRGASRQPAVINCLFGLLLWPGREDAGQLPPGPAH